MSAPLSRLLGPALAVLGGAGILVWYATAAATPYGLRVLTVAGVYALAVIGFQIIFGFAGALSLAQGTFYGLGGMVTGILAVRYGLPFEATFPLSVAVPVVLALIVAAPVLRLDSHYFALATLGIGQMVLLAAVHWQSLTGGANGIAGVPGVTLFGWTVARGLPLCLFVWGWVGVGAALAAWVGAGPRGLAFASLRTDALVARSLGLVVSRWRLAAFLLSAGLGGAAGALAVHSQRVVSPAVLEFPVMVTILTMAVVGGRGRILGTVPAALLLIHLPEWLRGLEQAYLLVYGVLLLATIVLMPAGLAGLGDRWRSPARANGGTSHPPARPPAPPPAQPERSQPGGDRLLAVMGLAKTYGGVRALDGVSFTVRPGEVVGVIGPNGSGKTTLLNLLSGIDRPDTGTIRLHDRDRVDGRAEQAAHLGIARTFQSGGLPPSLSALEAVAAARIATADRSRTAMAAHARHFLDLAGAAEAAGIACGDLPPGQQRRVELARALARQPALLLLDEPAAGLDEAERAGLGRLLRRVAADGTAVLVVEHDLGFLAGVADRLLCLDGGRLIFDGPADAVGEAPAVRAAYFGPAGGAP